MRKHVESYNFKILGTIKQFELLKSSLLATLASEPFRSPKLPTIYIFQNRYTYFLGATIDWFYTYYYAQRLLSRMWS